MKRMVAARLLLLYGYLIALGPIISLRPHWVSHKQPVAYTGTIGIIRVPASQAGSSTYGGGSGSGTGGGVIRIGAH